MQIANPFSGLTELVTEHEPLAPHTWYRIGGPAWVCGSNSTSTPRPVVPMTRPARTPRLLGKRA